MSSRASRWKNAEKSVAELLQKYKIPAKRRMDRNIDYSLSIDDIEIEGHPEIIQDSKYSQAGFRQNRMLDVVEEKYCKSKNDFPVLWTKGFRERGFKVTLNGTFFAMILAYWLGYGTKEELMDIYNGK